MNIYCRVTIQILSGWYNIYIECRPPATWVEIELQITISHMLVFSHFWILNRIGHWIGRCFNWKKKIITEQTTFALVLLLIPIPCLWSTPQWNEPSSHWGNVAERMVGLWEHTRDYSSLQFSLFHHRSALLQQLNAHVTLYIFSKQTVSEIILSKMWLCHLWM